MKSNQLFFLVFATGVVAALDSSLCFYPDGLTTEPTHSPCNLTVSASSCCDPLDACTASGLCLGRTGFNYRGTCTDKTWDSSNCAASCHAGKQPVTSTNGMIITHILPQIHSTMLPIRRLHHSGPVTSQERRKRIIAATARQGTVVRSLHLPTGQRE